YKSGVGRHGASLFRRRRGVRGTERQSVASASERNDLMIRTSLANAIATMLVAAASIGAQQPDLKAGPATADTSKDPHAAQPERPTVATHAGTVAPGWLELETGGERDRLAPSATLISTPTVFKIGLASRVHLS